MRPRNRASGAHRQVCRSPAADLPGMPVDMDDEDDDGPRGRSKPRRFGEEPFVPGGVPATTFGRILLGAGVVAVFSVVAVSAYALKSFLDHDSRFRIAGTSNIQATGLAAGQPRRDASGLWRRHRPQHLLRASRRAPQAARADSVDRACHRDAPAARPDPHLGGGAQADRLCSPGRAGWTGRCQWSAADRTAGHDGAASLLVSGGHGYRQPRPDRRAPRARWRCISASSANSTRTDSISPTRFPRSTCTIRKMRAC